jgi:1-acyl-sn-glycerol-3-phosphate acyltransferase
VDSHLLSGPLAAPGRRWLPAPRLLDALRAAWFRVTVEDIALVPRHGPVLLIANQSGLFAFGAALIARALAAHRAAGAGPVAFVSASSPLGPHRLFFPELDVRVGGPADALEALRQGLAVVIFPEGIAGVRKRLWDAHRLASFGRGGWGRVALQAGVPIVPVAIDGGQWAFPVLAELPGLAETLGQPLFPITLSFPWLGPLGLLPLPVRWSIRFGQPLSTLRNGVATVNDDLALDEILGQVRLQLQALLAGRAGGKSSS